MLTCYQGLFAVGKEESAVRLVHFTFREYTRGTKYLFRCWGLLGMRTYIRPGAPPGSHRAPAYSSPDNGSSLARLSEFAAGQGSFDQPFPQSSWNTISRIPSTGMHAKRKLPDRAELFAPRLFDDHHNHISINVLSKAEKSHFTILISINFPLSIAPLCIYL